MTRPRNRRCGILDRLRALTFAMTMVLVSSGAGSSTPALVSSTEATWSSTAHAAGELTAGTVPAPQLTAECRYRPGVLGLGARVEIYWAAPSGYTVDDAEIHASTSGLGSILAPLTGFSLTSNTSGGPDNYTTEVPTSLLGGLLGLGSELEVAILINDGGWTSESVSIATNAGLIGGIGGSCRNLT